MIPIPATNPIKTKRFQFCDSADDFFDYADFFITKQKYFDQSKKLLLSDITTQKTDSFDYKIYSFLLFEIKKDLTIQSDC